MKLSDQELVRRCKDGERQAFQELVERYQRKAVAIAVGILRDPDDGVDVAQEAFSKVYTSIAGFKEESSFSTWLYRIVVNLAIDRQRQQTRRSMFEWYQAGTREGEDWIESVPDTNEPEHPEHAEDRELGRHIWAAIDELTPAHKAVILLRAIEGLSYDEISQTLKCSRGTVMSRLHYARKKLQTRLDRYL